MADQNDYPIPFFKEGEQPIYAHGAEEAERHRAAGWVSDQKLLPAQPYPRMIYHQKTGESLRVNSADEEKGAAGYGRKKPEPHIIEAHAPKDPAAAAPRADNSEFVLKKLGEIMEQFVDLRARVSDLEKNAASDSDADESFSRRKDEEAQLAGQKRGPGRPPKANPE